MSAGIRSALRLALQALTLVGVVIALPACYQNRVTRIDPAQVTDLSGRWNDTDSRLVANKLIEQSLGGDWVRRYVDSHGGQAPTVIVGEINNRTMDHIPVGTFVKDLERAFVTSGAVRVVASADERQDVRAERLDQQQHARADSRARLAQEQGARYMLQGEVQAIEYGQSREKVVYYQVDATLIDLESNAKVWVGQEKIKKYIERRPLGL